MNDSSTSKYPVAPHLTELLHTLPPDLQSEVCDFVEFLLEKRYRRELEQRAVAHGWPTDFFTTTVGSINDPSFVRQPQGVPEEREPLP
jgi:hypothetical protein